MVCLSGIIIRLLTSREGITFLNWVSRLAAGRRVCSPILLWQGQAMVLRHGLVVSELALDQPLGGGMLCGRLLQVRQGGQLKRLLALYRAHTLQA